MPEQLPVWEEREPPTTYVIDVHTKQRDYSILPRSDGGQNRDFLKWMNSFKIPLHYELRAASPNTQERLSSRNIDLAEIDEIVAQITDTQPYPVTRMVIGYDAQNGPAYKAAAKAKHFPKAMQFMGNNIAYGEFVHLMDFVRFRGSYLNRAPKSDVINTVAHTLGHAVLQRTTNIVIPEEIGEDGLLHPYSYSGYMWRYNNRYFGDALDEASSSKIAAFARRELGVRVKGEPSPNPVVESYRLKRGYSYAALGSIALDVLNKAAGLADELAIYRPIWAFMRAGSEESAREELAEIVGKATKGQINLEQLEAAKLSINGIPKALLQRIEIAAGIDASKRPSKHIKVAQVF